MTAAGTVSPAPLDHLTSRLLRAWLAVGVCDALWASTITTVYGRSVVRLWQFLAATAFGDSMYQGGVATAALGLGIHFAVAFAWSALFLLLLVQSARLRAVLDSPAGVFTLGVIYGPVIWIVMSLVVIPLFTHKAGVVNVRWGIEALGHMAFVGMPMMWGLRRR
jgi:hypothetical protein